MSEIILLTQIIFFEPAKQAFRFPIINPVRTSFWLLNGNSSTFSEIMVESNQILDVWELYKIKVKIVNGPFFQDKIGVNTEFKLGTFPFEIAYGRILEMQRQ